MINDFSPSSLRLRYLEYFTLGAVNDIAWFTITAIIYNTRSEDTLLSQNVTCI